MGVGRGGQGDASHALKILGGVRIPQIREKSVSNSFFLDLGGI